MLVFVDESGDTGMSGKPGQSDHFVVALVRCEDDDEGARADARIDELRLELRLHARFEFHFHSTKPDLRQRFLEATLPFDWGFLAFVMNKRALRSSASRAGDTLYNRTAQYVFENASPYLDNAKVVIDKRAPTDSAKNSLDT